MSKTDKTTPWKFAVCTDRCGYPCKHFSISKTLKVYTRKANRHHRTELRNALAAGREPEPARTRHSAQWEAV